MHVSGGMVYICISGPELHAYQFYSIALLIDIDTRFLSVTP